ncbi:MAG: translocation and assembly module TamB [Janthinobacterium sp.]|jgi:translocation and assembly module TamB
MSDHTPPTAPTAPTPASKPDAAAPPHLRRWPRRLLIAVLGIALLLGAAFWLLGRESTLQLLVQKVSAASGGQVDVRDVSGSLYGTMHIGHASVRSKSSNITAVDIDINWSPLQFFSNGIEVKQLRAASLSIESIGPSTPAVLPQSLAPPFRLAIADARVGKLTLISSGAGANDPAAPATVIDNLRLRLHGDPDGWRLQDASAATPWGLAQFEASIDAHSPFKLDAKASLTQAAAGTESDPESDAKPARLSATVGGNLSLLEVTANARSGTASGAARLTLAPFDAILLRDIQIDGSGIDPARFNPAWPQADLSMHIDAALTSDQSVSGTLALSNHGAPGPLDTQRLPLRSIKAQLAGTLTATRIEQIVLDLAQAGQVTGDATIARAGVDAPIDSAEVKLQAARIDLKAILGSLKTTQIGGPIDLHSEGLTQTLTAALADQGVRLDVRATIAGAMLQVQLARLSAGKGSIGVTGQAALDQLQAFTLKASALHFDPAALGQYPTADLNGDLMLKGQLLPQWQVGAELKLRASRLLNQPLSGSASLQADATHVSAVDATLALGRNTLKLAGAFGTAGEQLTWRAAAPQLSSVHSSLAGALAAHGIIEGTLKAPRSSFELNAQALGLNAGLNAKPNAGTASKPAAGKDKNNDSLLQASGVITLRDPGRQIDVKLNGSARGLNPRAFGPYASGSINGDFNGSISFGDGAKMALDLALQPSTLSNAPLSGHARLVADTKRISSADIDLKLGPNVLLARGSFGAASDQIDWTLEAPQLATLGPHFGGALRGSGMLAGTLAAPTLSVNLDGKNLRVLDVHRIKMLHANARLDSDRKGTGADGALMADIEIKDYRSPSLALSGVRVQTSGSRAAHRLTINAGNSDFDADLGISGGFSEHGWSGTLNTLRNRGRQAFALQAPVPVQIVGPADGGLAGLLQPERISVKDAVLALSKGSIRLQQLEKNGTQWRSNGQATGVALSYLAPPALQETVRGDLTLGASWSLKLQAAPGTASAKTDMTGMLHVFREKGDITVGTGIPLALGLTVLDARIDVQGNTLRVQANVDGARAGTATLDASTQLVQGRIADTSVLRATASANLPSLAPLAPLTGQPGLNFDGALKMALSAGGSIKSPVLGGTINGEKLMLNWAEHGIKLSNGQLQAKLDGDRLLLQRLRFDGVKGNAQAEGWLRFANAETSMQIKLIADQLQVLARPDRTLVVSGNSTLQRDLKTFSFDGKFKVDRAAIELTAQDTPTISDDVVVLGRASAKPQAPGLPLGINVEIDLGDAFRLQGFGLDARLAGNVRVRALQRRPPTVLGSIRVLSGTYDAYGQKLTLERGVLNFTGAYDNPGLNILALRKRPEGTELSVTNVEAGVEIRGTALAPVAKLVSTPTVPDSEKLSWLVLGHGTDGGSQLGLLSSAAGALLSGGKGDSLQSKVADTFGLDSIGLSQATGTATGLEATVVTVGKRISRRAYLSFEQGVGAASSLVKLRYTLNERISLQFQTGANSAFDVLYTWSFD